MPTPGNSLNNNYAPGIVFVLYLTCHCPHFLLEESEAQKEVI